MIKKLFPYGKSKALCLSYDDGVVQDVKLAELLRKYNLTATFNLNSELSRTEFNWTHSSGKIITRLPHSVIKTLYDGFEVASHTRSHPYMENLTEAEIMEEMADDKEALEKIIYQQIYGFAVPFHYYSSLIRCCAINCGFEYSRCSDVTHGFNPWEDYFAIKSTAFHLDEKIDELTEQFLATEQELAIFHLIGHSYDLDTHNAWAKTESLFERISKSEDVLSATTLELVRYLKAMDMAEITPNLIINKSSHDLYFGVDGETLCVKAHTTYTI